MKPLITLICILALLISCKKNDTPEVYTYANVNDSMKSLIFQKGSYWIYKSDSSQGTDSTYIYSIEHNSWEIGFGLNQNLIVEYYMLTYASFSAIKYSSYKDYIETNHMLINPRLIYPQAYGPVIYCLKPLTGNFYLSKNRYHDSLTINNHTFYKVQESRFLLHGDSTVFFIEPNIGLIKKVVYSDSIIYSWGIIKWNIIK